MGALTYTRKYTQLMHSVQLRKPNDRVIYTTLTIPIDAIHPRGDVLVCA